jgi:putative DNA primase/helicase
LLAEVAEFKQYNKRSGAVETIDVPNKVASTLLVSEDIWAFPRASGVTLSPGLRADGSLLTEPGWDPVTQLILVPDPGLQLPPADNVPTRDNALAALKQLKELLHGFCLNPVDLSAALSAILTAALRPTISVAPLHLVRATTSGAGKSYLVDIICAIVTGRECPVSTIGETQEESEKRLGGMLLAGMQFVTFDNLSRDLEGDLLCQVAERQFIRIRILGSSDVVEFENRSMATATGNNIGPAGDMVRRTIVCNLGTDVERPEFRAFDSDPLETVLANRSPWLWCCYQIMRAYILAGRPPVEMTPLGSYKEWNTTVRAALIWLGEEDPVKSMEQAREEDPILTDIQELFRHWQHHFSLGRKRTALQIAERGDEVYTNKDCEYSGDFSKVNKPKYPEFRDLLIRRAGDRGVISTKRLGWWLRGIIGKIVDDRCLRFAAKETGHHGRAYFFEEVKPNG